MRKEFFHLTKNTKFVYLWSSQILSQLTINIMNFILLIRLFDVTRSSVATSLLWVSYAIPAMVIGPIAAVVVDMVDRRKMLMITNFLQGAAILIYATTYEGKIFLLYGITLIYSFLNQFYVPAESATVPKVVSKNDLPFANSLFFITQQFSLIVGFGIAGLLNHLLGFEKSLYLCSVLLFLAFIAVSFLPSMKPELKIPKKAEDAVLAFFKRIYEGYMFIRVNPNIMFPFFLLIALQISVAVIIVNVPVIALNILKMNPNLAGILVVVPVGAGALTAASSIPKMLKSGVRKRKLIEVSLGTFAILFLVFAIAVPHLPNIVKFFVSVILFMLAGYSFLGIMIPAQTYLQEATPGGMMGRVFGNFWFLVTLATIIPVMFSGAITDIFGIRLLFLILSVLAASALIASKRMRVRGLKSAVASHKILF